MFSKLKEKKEIDQKIKAAYDFLNQHPNSEILALYEEVIKGLTSDSKGRYETPFNLPTEYQEKFNKYAEAVINSVYPFDEKGNIVNEILPPWIIYPFINDNEWTKGLPELYLAMYGLFIKRLSNDEKIIYEQKYNKPNYFTFS